MKLTERSSLATSGGVHDTLRWKARWRVEKYDGDWTEEQIAMGEAGAPYEVIEREGNLAMYGGVSCLWQGLMGNGTATPGQNLTHFDNANAAIGVGNGTAAAAATQTDLQGASSLRKGMEAGYPSHTDGETSGAADITFRSVFGDAEANFAWEEWGVFNSATAATGRMLNRKVETVGTKSSGTWTFTVTLSLA